MASWQPLPVSFRDLVPGMSTTYLTHGLFHYPARFIPQVPHYCIHRFSPQGGWVLDPFAGSGTVGLEAVLARRKAFLLDLNPLLERMVELKVNFRERGVNEEGLVIRYQAMLDWEEGFYPQWKDLDRWYPPEILEALARYWGWYHRHAHDPYAQILWPGLLRASRRFSWAEHRLPKLFRSKRKLQEMQELLQGDWRKKLEGYLWKWALKALTALRELAQRTWGQEGALARGGVDSASPIEGLPQPHLVLTSPPYLQAQEYIRTLKLDLLWSGYALEEVQGLARLEIPYRPAPQGFHTPTYSQVRERVAREDLRRIMEAYFYWVGQALRQAGNRLNPGGYLCLFVGSSRVDGVSVPTWRILAEHLEEGGFVLEEAYEDAIKARQLPRGRRNKNPEGIGSEVLLVLRRT